MDFGVCVASKIDEIGYITHAENLGYSHAWIADSQMIWSDCYAVLALAAQQTRTIRLGTGVAVAGVRLAPVIAHSIATINRLVPGRTFLGIGTGNTAMRLMGQKPLRLQDFAHDLGVIRALLRGEDAEFTWRGQTSTVRLMMPEYAFIDIASPIPIYVSSFGPKAQAVAGEYGDGLVMSIPPQPDFLERALRHAQFGVERAGRTWAPETFYTCSLTTAVILEPGESLTSERVLREYGPFVISSLHYLYDKIRQWGGHPPSHVRGMVCGRRIASSWRRPLNAIGTCASTPDIAPICSRRKRSSSPLSSSKAHAWWARLKKSSSKFAALKQRVCIRS